MFRPISLILLSILASGCANPPVPPTPSPTSSASLPAPDVDGFAATLLAAKKNRQPALRWLANRRDHILWKGNRDAILAHFRELEAAGTKEIWACTQDLKDKQICPAFVVVLPSSEGDRRRAFELHNKFWQTQIADPRSLEAVEQHEQHQKYLLYSFD